MVSLRVRLHPEARQLGQYGGNRDQRARHAVPDRRIDNMETVRSEVAAWQARRDNLQAKVNWQFTAKDARVKLKRLYPTTTS